MKITLSLEELVPLLTPELQKMFPDHIATQFRTRMEMQQAGKWDSIDLIFNGLEITLEPQGEK